MNKAQLLGQMIVCSIGIYAVIGYVVARAYENLFEYTQPVRTFLMASTAGLIVVAAAWAATIAWTSFTS
jgi:hypothetical protein